MYDCIIKMKSKATHGTSGLSVAKMHLLMSYFDLQGDIRSNIQIYRGCQLCIKANLNHMLAKIKYVHTKTIKHFFLFSLTVILPGLYIFISRDVLCYFFLPLDYIEKKLRLLKSRVYKTQGFH